MKQDKKSSNNGYELRKAAGLYWLLDLRQGGEHYKPPLAMNEMGAEIFKYRQLGDSEEEIIRKTGNTYDADVETIKRDVTSFLKKLKEYETE